MEGKECIWSGIDYALEPPVRRGLKAVFSSIQAAQEIHTFFEDVSKLSLHENIFIIYIYMCVCTHTHMYMYIKIENI